MQEVFKYIVIGLAVVSAIGQILLIGEPRKSYTRGAVAINLIVNSLLVWGFIKWL